MSLVGIENFVGMKNFMINSKTKIYCKLDKANNRFVQITSNRCINANSRCITNTLFHKDNRPSQK